MIRIKQSGASLIEIVLVLAIIGFIGLLIANLPASMATITRSSHQAIATRAVEKQIELLRQSGYDNLNNGQSQFVDSSLQQLSSATASYQIDDCTAPICMDQQDLKVVTVTVWWKEAGQDKNVSMTTLVGSGGLGQ